MAGNSHSLLEFSDCGISRRRERWREHETEIERERELCKSKASRPNFVNWRVLALWSSCLHVVALLESIGTPTHLVHRNSGDFHKQSTQYHPIIPKALLWGTLTFPPWKWMIPMESLKARCFFLETDMRLTHMGSVCLCVLWDCPHLVHSIQHQTRTCISSCQGFRNIHAPFAIESSSTRSYFQNICQWLSPLPIYSNQFGHWLPDPYCCLCWWQKLPPLSSSKQLG